MQKVHKVIFAVLATVFILVSCVNRALVGEETMSAEDVASLDSILTLAETEKDSADDGRTLVDALEEIKAESESLLAQEALEEELDDNSEELPTILDNAPLVQDNVSDTTRLVLDEDWAKDDSFTSSKEHNDSSFLAEQDAALQSALQFVQTHQRDTVIAMHYDKNENKEKNDTIHHSSGIDSPVEYSAKDSLVYDALTGNAILYGSANVKYQNMTLDAERISMNMDSSLVHAYGVADSLGNRTGDAVYKQGSETYNSESMTANFKTKKAYISNVTTEQGDGFLQSNESKRTDDGTFYIQDARYTTCDAEHPHFYLKLTKGKIRPGKDTFFGPAYLVVEDVPLPLAVPYGFFPFSKSYSSGIIMPTYGDETARGFYLREGGYYLALSDKMDLKILGEIYTKGSWGISGETSYAKRYKFRGNAMISYQSTVNGEKNLPDYSHQTSLKVTWTHSSDAKANPNQSFSARVNFASQNYEKTNLTSMYNPTAYTQSTRASSVSYNRNVSKIGMSIAASGNITQNMRDSSLAVTLPDLSISVSRFYPFRRKNAAGKDRWYEKISMSYTGQFSNSFNGKESDLLHSNFAKDWKNGMQHRVPIDATFQLFKYINISPSLSFRDMMYLSRFEKDWDTKRQKEVVDTVFGFYNLYDWSTSLSANTTLYGFYKPWKKLFGDKIQAIRHVFKPNVSFSYAPDFSSDRYGYYDYYVKTDAQGNVSTVRYSPYQGTLYGYPTGTKTGSINFGVSNNLEMKVKSERDTTGFRKISLIDELTANMSYNLAAQTHPWSDLNMRVRLKLSKRYTFSLNAVFATYAYEMDENGKVTVGNKTEYSQGRFGRFQGMSQNLSYTINNEKAMMFFDLLRGRGWKDLFAKYTGKEEKDKSKNNYNDDEYDEDDDELIDDEDANVDPDLKKGQKDKGTKKQGVDKDGYLAFSFPWSFTMSYGVSMRENTQAKINERRMRYPYSFTQTLSFSGFVRIAQGWNITFTSGYDFNYHDLSMTTISLNRDLHCFEMTCSVVLKPYTSYNFSFRARASELADALRYEKKSSYSRNINWY